MAAWLAVASSAAAQTTVLLNQTTFQVADGWSLQQVAGEPLTRYPVHADVAADGSLFIVESSGSNEPVQVQFDQRPHRLVTLRDTDGDGVYDQRVVFAEGLMLPQGVLWTPNGVLVATPPEIWLFRDTDGDGISDQRQLWFDGQTLTGCANDVHGPFLGRDGMIHWAKGAFAEQTYRQASGKDWTTRASHVFRRSFDGHLIEPVMTGGMDNPVEFAQSLCGERFFTCTFVQYPADGRRDALVHAVYGGVYGKDHGVLQGHPRTGPLMPVMTHLGPAAPAGLTLRQSTLSDEDPLGELLVAHFNLQRVTRHRLVEDGAALATQDSDLLVADRADFHPTDVLEDIDGSLLVVDTGGWYTLCCPTSHIAQSQATGAIYRLRPTGPQPAKRQPTTPDTDSLVAGLAADRPTQRLVARQRLLAAADGPQQLIAALADPANSWLGTTVARTEAVWTLIEAIGRSDAAGQRSASEPLYAALIDQLGDSRQTVRLAATQGLGVYRHQPAVPALLQRLQQAAPREQRYAAEALGRIGDQRAIEPLLAAIARQAQSPLGSADAQRVAQHSLLYALIEIGPAVTDSLLPHLAIPSLNGGDASGSDSGVTAQRMAALRVLDLLDSPALTAETVLALLDTDHDGQRELAIEVLGRRPDWDAEITQRLPDLLARGASQGAESWPATVQRLVLRPGLSDAVATILAAGPDVARQQIRQALVARPPTELPPSWSLAIAQRLQIVAGLPDTTPDDNEETLQWCRIVAAVPWRKAAPPELQAAFQELLKRHRDDRSQWLVIAAAAPPGVQVWQAAGSDNEGGAQQTAGAIAFGDLLDILAADSSPAERQLTLATLGRHPLTADQQRQLANRVAVVGPMELTGLLALLRSLHDAELNAELLAALAANPQTAGLPASWLQMHFADHPAEIQRLADALIQQVAGDELAQRRDHMQQLMASLPSGDSGRGMDVFRSTSAACSGCHAIGYVGGKVGPDLTGIRRIRTDYDLVEAIVYPSASFVRSYETVQVMTFDGRAISGMIADEDPDSITLTTGIDQRVRVQRDDIDTLRPGAVSIMPAGLDQQLTPQQLADLLAFLKAQL